MNYRIVPSEIFVKSLKRLLPQEQKRVHMKLELLQNDPFHPSLRTKKIKALNDVFECSINMDIRLLWKYSINDSIVLLNVGHHSILDKI